LAGEIMLKTLKSNWQSALKHIGQERRELVLLCSRLTPEEWETPSLCEGWKVRDVVAHIIGTEHDRATYLTAGFDQANQKIVEKYRSLPTNILTTRLAEVANPGLVAQAVPHIILFDNWVHQQDIRWVVGPHRQREQDPERLKIILDWLVTPMDANKGAGAISPGPRWVLAGLSKLFSRLTGPKPEPEKEETGLQFVATDLDWRTGKGALVSGPAEAIIMALAKRPAALKRLEGPGVAILEQQWQRKS
jgi:uncharacterized protein (TIGR03083 family)